MRESVTFFFHAATLLWISHLPLKDPFILAFLQRRGLGVHLPLFYYFYFDWRFHQNCYFLSNLTLCITVVTIFLWYATKGQSFLQGIISTQGSNPGLMHHRQILYGLSHQNLFVCLIPPVDLELMYDFVMSHIGHLENNYLLSHLTQ